VTGIGHEFYGEQSAAFAQTAAGTNVLIAAPAADKKIIVTGYVFTMSAGGTAKFTDSAGDLSGAMDIAANSGVSNSRVPLFGAKGSAISIVTTTGFWKGHVAYKVVPA